MKKIYLFLIFFLITIHFIQGDTNASSQNYSLRLYTLGLHGGVIQGSDLNATVSSTAFQAGSNNVSSNNYSAGVGFFSSLSSSSQALSSNNSQNQLSSGGTSSSGGSSSGGSVSSTGGGIISNLRNEFSVDTEKISIALSQGNVQTKKILIKNEGINKLNIEINKSSLGDLVDISEENFSINPGQIKEITLDFIAREDTIPNLYLGKIIIKSDNTKKEILTAVEITSKNPLLDVKVELIQGYQQIVSGDNLLAQITLYNLGNSKGDIQVEYFIKNLQGEQILYQNEAIALETQATFVKNLVTPSNIPVGDYILYIKATYNGKVSSASTEFKVISPKENVYILLIGFIILVLTLIINYNLKSGKNNNIKGIKKISLNDIIKK